MLRHLGPRGSLRLMRHTQHFSSSSSPNPPSPSFYDELSQYVKRIVDRKYQFKRYREHSVFPPNNWTLHNYYLYAQLQLPTKTEVDAVEFLNGARFACDRVIEAMHSKELIDFAAGDVPRPQIADEMEQMFEQTCYERLLLPRVRSLAMGTSSLELKELDFTGVYLSGVYCQRTTRANVNAEDTLRAAMRQALAEKYKDKKMDMRPNAMDLVSDLSAIKEKVEKTNLETEPDDDEEILERLHLNALFHTTQTVVAVSAKTSERVSVKTEVKTMLCFESMVTEPDDVDWRIIKIKQSGRVVSRSKDN